MHRNERSNVSPVESRHPLPESSRSLHQLYLRRREPRADMAGERVNGFVVPEVHTRGDRLRPNIACESSQNRPAPAANNSWADPFQIERERRRIRTLGYYVHGFHPGATGSTRCTPRQRGYI